MAILNSIIKTGKGGTTLTKDEKLGKGYEISGLQ